RSPARGDNPLFAEPRRAGRDWPSGNDARKAWSEYRDVCLGSARSRPGSRSCCARARGRRGFPIHSGAHPRDSRHYRGQVAPAVLGEELVLSKRPSSIIRKKRIKPIRSEEHTSELQSRFDLVCRLLLEKKKKKKKQQIYNIIKFTS